MKYSGKTLLVLGSNALAPEIVRYARSNGAYTIVADWLDPSKSPAKLVADEHVLISTADVDALCSFVYKRSVNGVIAGVSEFNLMRAMEVSERCDLPFYCTKEQWNSLERKDCFRALCVEYGVPRPETYYTGASKDEALAADKAFPLVVKPVDCASSAGVHICANELELALVLDDALGRSASGTIILEECVTGSEFTAHFTVVNRHASFSCADNRYPVAVHEGRVTTIPVARIYPSTFVDRIATEVAPQICRMLEGIGLVNAVICNSQTGRIAVFEAGLRSAGEAPCRFLSRVNNIDYMANLVDVALLGHSTLDSSLDDPMLGGRCCGVISFVALGGRTVGSIEGLEDAVTACQGVIGYESRYPVGSITPDTDTLRQLMIRFVMDCPSREELVREIAHLNNAVTVLDDAGHDMVVRPDPVALLCEPVAECGILPAGGGLGETSHYYGEVLRSFRTPAHFCWFPLRKAA